MSAGTVSSSPAGWRLLFGRRLALVIGAGILLFFLLLAIGAPVVAPL